MLALVLRVGRNGAMRYCDWPLETGLAAAMKLEDWVASMLSGQAAPAQYYGPTLILVAVLRSWRHMPLVTTLI